MWTALVRSRSGLSEQDVANSLLLTLSSSAQISPSYWVNPANGIEYNVAVQAPQFRMDSLAVRQQYSDLLCRSSASPVAAVARQPGPDESQRPASADFPLQQSDPVIDVYSSVEGRDMGGVANDIPRHHEGFSPASCPAERRCVLAARWPR